MFDRKTLILAITSLAAALVALAVGPSARAATAQITACGQTVTTNAVLAQDLSCAGTGIVVGAPGITIDLQGHVLKGNHSLGPDGIDDSGYDVTIKNGVIRNFDDGVIIASGSSLANVSISNVVSTGNVRGGFVVYGDRVLINASNASGNGTVGIEAWGEVSVKSTTASGNGTYGIWVRTGNSSVRSSRALGNASTGIQLEGDSNSVISSTTSGNGWSGLYIEGNSASVKSTTASGNVTHGIEVGGEGATLTGNHVEGNGMQNGTSDGNGLGILVVSFVTAPKGKNVARGNDDAAECQPSSLCSVTTKAKPGLQISSCGQVVTTNAVLTKDLSCVVDGIVVGAAGITIDLQGHTLTGDHVHEGVHNKDGYHNVTLKNGVIRGFDKGVSAYSGSDDMTIANVALVGNADVGAYVNGESLSITSSTASGNGHEGFYVLGNNASISKSTAAGNGTSGIYAWGDATSIASTAAAGNTVIGIWLIGAEASLKSSNAAGNASTGVWLQGGGASIASLTASGNGMRGIYVQGNSASVTSTTASGNGSNGIDVGGNNATLNHNRAEGNGFPGGMSDGLGFGIYVVGGAPVGTNAVRGNDDAGECSPSPLC